MRKNYKWLHVLIILQLFFNCLFGQVSGTEMFYKVSMERAPQHYYHVELTCNNLKEDSTDFNMCAWTPGYYEIIHYEKAIENFHAIDDNQKEITWYKPSSNVWRIANKKNRKCVIEYDVKATVLFVGNVYVDEQRGYITPGGLFMYVKEDLNKPVTIQFKPYEKWPSLIATGLDSIPGKANTFYAANFDVLYDSPFLMGNLEQLPDFFVNKIPHHFIGYDIGNFDKAAFINDLQKIITSGVNIIGDIPYTHYSFLSIGHGGGGIEHLNSTSITMRGENVMQKEESKKSFYEFLAHEYFHHYNVKRIRPIELGPFDYSKENRTRMLWVSEGFTDYYATLILKDAGLINEADVFKTYQEHIKAYENVPGHLFQSATESSMETWSGNPFAKSPEEAAKTISYYDKGCILGLMIDFTIRHETNNKKSLDDVMRILYKKYYQALKRGFTEKEFRMECESAAGGSLQELFDYASTVKNVNYPKYFTYAGLAIDTVSKALPGLHSGCTLAKNDSAMFVRNIEWNSPAWKAGLKIHDVILQLNDSKPSPELFSEVLNKTGEQSTLNLLVARDGQQIKITIHPEIKYEKSFTISKMQNADALQSAIYKSWMRN